MAGVPSFKNFKFAKPKKGEGTPGNFGLPSPAEVVKKVTSGKAGPNRGSAIMGSRAAAADKPAAAKPKNTNRATPALNKAADRAFKSQERDEKYRKSREQLGQFYLQSAGGYGSDWFSKKKK